MSMNMNLEHVKAFNKYAKDFLNMLIARFPYEQIPITRVKLNDVGSSPIEKMKSYLSQFIMMEIMDPTAPIKLFMSTMEEFGPQLMSRNEDFFKQETCVSGAESFSGSLGLVSCWDSLSIETKNLIWNYMQSLFVTAMGALNKQQELKKLMKK